MKSSNKILENMYCVNKRPEDPLFLKQNLEINN